MTGRSGEPPILEVRNLTKYFPVGGLFAKKQLRALNDVSFTLERAEILAVVGESGSGKSTVARIIARLLQPSSGAVLLSGKNVLESEPRRASLDYRRRVQMIFQDPFGSLNPVHTIAHHLERPLILHGKAGKNGELTKKVHELLESVGLTPPAEFAAKHPHETSGGQRQRVAVARALAVDPDVILADEPVSMLDVSIRAGVLNLMERLKNERRVAFVYITHDIASARYVADRTLVMYAGHVVESAPSDELVESPAHPYTKQLLAAVPDPTRALASVPSGKGRAGAPALVDPPPGCPFAPRCPDVMSVCKTEMPKAIEVGKGHSVRCHLHTLNATEPAKAPSSFASAGGAPSA